MWRKQISIILVSNGETTTFGLGVSFLGLIISVGVVSLIIGNNLIKG